MNRGRWIVKFLVLGLAALLIIGFVTQSLWNWLVPVLFAGPVITFWQALGLLLLSKILFFHFGGKRSHGPQSFGWKAKMMRMSPEEREKFKQKMWAKWCPPSEPAPDRRDPQP